MRRSTLRQQHSCLVSGLDLLWTTGWKLASASRKSHTASSGQRAWHAFSPCALGTQHVPAQPVRTHQTRSQACAAQPHAPQAPPRPLYIRYRICRFRGAASFTSGALTARLCCTRCDTVRRGLDGTVHCPDAQDASHPVQVHAPKRHVVQSRSTCRMSSFGCCETGGSVGSGIRGAWAARALQLQWQGELG